MARSVAPDCGTLTWFVVFFFRAVVAPQRRYPVPFAMYLYRFIAASVRVRDEQGQDRTGQDGTRRDGTGRHGTESHNFRNDQWYKWNSFASQTPLPSLSLSHSLRSVLMRCRKSSKSSNWTPFNVCNNKLNHIWAFLLLSFLCFPFFFCSLLLGLCLRLIGYACEDWTQLHAIM